jgi:glycerol-3-phosphate dehydrogenase subunit B
VAHTAGGERQHAARHVILATGGFRHGGLEANAPGQARESVFGLPVECAPEWFAPHYWDPHPYAKFGVRANSQMQPIDPAGAIIYENVSIIGGLLAGADRDADGCREALDLATAWAALEHLSITLPAPA